MQSEAEVTAHEARDLAALANRAALQIEHHMRDVPTSLEAVRAFADRLATSVIRPVNGTSAELMDTAAALALSQASSEVDPGNDLDSLREIADLASDLEEKLRGWLGRSGDNAAGDWLIRFCHAFSDALTSVEAESEYEDDDHPYYS